MEHSPELSKLKSKIFQGNSEIQEIAVLVKVMQAVGGYEQLMNMSLPAVRQVADALEYLAKQEAKSMRKK